MLPPDLLFLLSFSMGCALYDLKTGKIPNFFVLCGLLCGSATLLLSCAGASLSTIFRIRFPVFNLAQSDPASCILGFLLPYLLFGLPVLLGMIGGGDVKLLSVSGLFLGAEAVWNVIQTSVLIGAVYAGFVLVRHRNGYQRFMFLRNYLCEVASVLRSRQTPPASLPAVRTPACPFQVSILPGQHMPALCSLIPACAAIAARGRQMLNSASPSRLSGTSCSHPAGAVSMNVFHHHQRRSYDRNQKNLCDLRSG